MELCIVYCVVYEMCSFIPCVSLGQVNVNSLLKSSSDGCVEDPGYVGGSQDQDTIIVIANPLHLHQELCLDPPR